MAGFLVMYNRRTGAMQLETFPGDRGHRAALQKRFELEEQRVDPDIEIVSLNADSIETLRSTHSRYFAREEAQASLIPAH